MLERLQKIISRAGIASRRHAEELIRSGQVRVNGVVVSALGSKADPEHDRVEAAGQLAVVPLQAGYYILNKPAHVVSTMSDPEGRATLRHLLKGLPGVFPVGRLDYAASGLVLLTSDGALADRIFKNSARMPQVYWVKVKGKLSDETQRQVRAEAHARLRLLRAPGAAGADAANPWYEVEIGDARRDLLRSSLFALDHPVEKMRRVKLGPLDLGDLDEARYRALEPAEIEQLRQAIARAEKAPHAPPVKSQKKYFRPRHAFPPAGKETGDKLTPPMPMPSPLSWTAPLPPGFASRPPAVSFPPRGSPRVTSGGPPNRPRTTSAPPGATPARSERGKPGWRKPRWRKDGPPAGSESRVPPGRGRQPSKPTEGTRGRRPERTPSGPAPSGYSPSFHPPFGRAPSGRPPTSRPGSSRPRSGRPPSGRPRSGPPTSGRGPRKGPR